MIGKVAGGVNFKWELHGSCPSDIDKYLQKKQGVIGYGFSMEAHPEPPHENDSVGALM